MLCESSEGPRETLLSYMTCLKSVFKVDDAQQNFVFYAEDLR